MNWQETLNRRTTRRLILGGAAAGTGTLLLKAAVGGGDIPLPQNRTGLNIDAANNASKQIFTEEDFGNGFDDFFYESKSTTQPNFSIGLPEGETKSPKSDVTLLKGKANMWFEKGELKMSDNGGLDGTMNTYRMIIVTPEIKGDYRAYPHLDSTQTVYYLIEGQMPKYAVSEKDPKTGVAKTVIKDLSPNDLFKLNGALSSDFPSKSAANSKKA